MRNKNNTFFQRGDQQIFIFVFMFITLMLLTFLGLFYAKSFAFKEFKKIAPTKEGMENTMFFDGNIVNVSVKGMNIRAELAVSDSKLKEGLSNKQSMSEGEGKLFAPGTLGAYSVWNKDLLIPLDVIWIKNNRVVGLFRGLPVYEDGDKYVSTPSKESNFVLEINAGLIDKYKVKLGDKVNISK